MADHQADRFPPWTIKSMPPDARHAAAAAADRDGMTQAEWLARAIRTQIQEDRRQTRMPVVIGPAPAPAGDPAQPQADLPALVEIERTVAMIRELADAGAPVPKGVQRAAYQLLRSRLTNLRGQTKAAAGQTHTLAGQTAEPSGQTTELPRQTEEAFGQTAAA